MKKIVNHGCCLIACCRVRYIFHERAVCHKSSIYRNIGDKKALQILNRPAVKHAMFSGIYKGKQFFCGYNILTKSVFVIQLSSKVGISEELLFLERYIGVFWIMRPCSLVGGYQHFGKNCYLFTSEVSIVMGFR